MAHADYYYTSAWYRLRDRVKHRAEGVCEFCRHRFMQECHHRTYARFGRELLRDLMAVCKPCHRAIHGLLSWKTTLTCCDGSLLADGDSGMGHTRLWQAYLRGC